MSPENCNWKFGKKEILIQYITIQTHVFPFLIDAGLVTAKKVKFTNLKSKSRTECQLQSTSWATGIDWKKLTAEETLNSLPDDKTLDLSKLRAFAEENQMWLKC